MKQRELAECLGVSAGTVSVWERGSRLPDMGTIERVSRFFGVSKARLLGVPLEADVEPSAAMMDMFRALNPVTQNMIAAMIAEAYRLEVRNED